MNKTKRIAWLFEKMAKINSNRGLDNGFLVALCLDQILNFPAADMSAPVPAEDEQLQVATLFTYDKRILERSVTKSFVKVDRIFLVDKIIRLPRRKLDGSAHGFIINNEKNSNNAHVTNFLVDRFDNVYFLDAIRVDHPETFIADIPPLGFKRDVWFIQSMPPEGLMSSLDALAMASEALLPEVSVALSGSSDAFVPAKRARRATKRIVMDTLTSKSSYGSEAFVLNDSESLAVSSITHKPTKKLR